MIDSSPSMPPVRPVDDLRSGPATAATDGRRARAERSKDAVVDAILALIQEGDEYPGAADIAARAGVSTRSVFRHFDDLESLRAAAVMRHVVLIGPLFHFDNPGGTVDERVRELVAHRGTLYEELTPVRRVAERLRQSSDAISAGLDLSRHTLNEQLTSVFAPELDTFTGDDWRVRLEALEAATSWSLWNQLRVTQGLTKRRTAVVMHATVLALLAGDPRG